MSHWSEEANVKEIAMPSSETTSRKSSACPVFSSFETTRRIAVSTIVVLLLFVLSATSARAQTNHAPNPPQIVSPDNGASNVGSPVILNVAASDADADRLTVTFYGRQHSATGADFVIAVYGDTQNYYSTYTSSGIDYLKSQSQWVVANLQSKNVAFVAHVGDVTFNNVDPEWQYASNALAPLEDSNTTGLLYGIPFDVAIGNHDLLGGSSTLYNTYFGVDRFAGRTYYGGHYSTTNNSHYDLFTAGGVSFIVVELAFGPSSAELAWANQTLRQYSDWKAIVISHELISPGDPASWSGSGLTIYNALKGNPNLFLMLCGHNGGDGKRTDVYQGNTVYTLMTDYSGDKNGGNGYIRLLSFSPAANNIHITTYSPTAGNRAASPTWDLPFAMGASYTTLGTTSVPAGSNATVTWNNLAPDTQYDWYASVSDGTATTKGATWAFSTTAQLAPAAPSALVATGVPSRKINLTWSDNSTNESAFEIYRSLDGNTFTPLATVGANTMAYSDTDLGLGATYYYQVRASNTIGSSQFSNTASATIATYGPAAPSSLTAASASSQINLGWKDNSNNEDGFTIERSTDGVAFAVLATAPANAISYADKTGKPDITYYYRVQAFNTAAASAYSNLASAEMSEITIGVTADVTIRADYPSGNFGTETELKVDGTPLKQVLLKFTVDNSLAERTITKALFRIWCSTDGSVFGGSFYRVADSSWTENGVTWNNAPTADPTPIASLGRVATGLWYNVDLTGFITGPGTYSLLMKTTNADGVYYSSKEGSNPPQLALTVEDFNNVAPVGSIDEIRSSDGVVRGWAYDSDASASSLHVKAYVDGPSGQGTLLATIPTSVLRTDVNSTYNITGNHGFEYMIPALLRDGRSHSLYVYAVDSSNSSVTTLLAGSPKSFTFAPLGTAAFRFASWGDAQDGGSNSYVTSNAIANLNPTFTIFNGDFSDYGVVLDPATSNYSMQLMSNAFRGNPYGAGTNDNGVFLRTFLDRGNHDNHYNNPADWQTFFSSYAESQGTTADRVARIGASNYSFMSGQDSLTYSFDYSNSRFIMVDVPGSSLDNLTSAEVTWIDQRLTEAETSHPELMHAFLSFHGALYCVSFHCDCAGQRASCLGSAGGALVTVINNHPIVTALFHGHEHNLGWTHLDDTRISNLTHPVEQFITSPAGQPTMNTYVQMDGGGVPYRFDYVETANEDQAFGIIDVAGASYTVSLYRVGNNTPAWTHVFTKSINALPSAPTNLSAVRASSTQIDLAWTNVGSNADTNHIERSVDGEATWSEITTVAANFTAYSDTGVTAGTTASYRVRARNANGYSAYSNTATATTGPTAPAAPTSLTATSANTTQIDLAWTDNSDNEDGFQIERSSDGTTFTPVLNVAANVIAYSNTGLTAATKYYYRVRANNTGGESAYSNIANATTGQTAPAAPTGLTATAAGSTQIDLSWTDNSDNESGFEIERSSDGTTFTPLATVAANVSVYNNTGLAAATKYYYRVRANNTGGESAYSNIANATTGQTAPAAPTGLTATAAGSSQINLAWTDNSDNESGFEIERSSDGATFTPLATVAANISAYSNTGLTAATKYYYRVRANNAGGDSDYTNIANATTGQTAPAAPTNLTATAAGTSQINLAWTDNSENESGFEIERSSDGATFTPLATVAANISVYNNTGLTAATKYYYRVRANNAGGDSAYSNIANSTTGQTAPAAPTGLTATAAGSTQIDLSWTDNSDNESGFEIERSSDGTTFTPLATVAANVSVYNNTGLAAATKYYYRVRANNTGGESAYSNIANATTGQTAPAAPTGLTATAAGSSQINLAWTDNSDNEDGFKVERSPNNVTFTQIATVATNVTAYNDTGLSAGTTYYYRVRANNTAGDSAYSNASSATTAEVVPATPTTLTATAASTSQINLAWTDNADNESGFEIERSPNNVTFTQIATVATNVSTYNDTGLSAGTTYYYRVRAFNAAGSSSYSNTATAATPQVPPVAPTSLAATAVSGTRINLTWADNSTNESGFRIERSLDGITFSSVATTAANVTSYGDTTVLPARTYQYRVRAYNSGGNSAYSNIASATTPQVVPAAPTSLSAKAISSSQITLTWRDNSSNEAGFTLERSLDGSVFTSLVTLAANTTAYTDSGLAANRRYWYRIRAYNAVGDSAYSNVANATTRR